MEGLSEVSLNASDVNFFEKQILEKETQFNYIVEMQKLVAELLIQIGRIASNDHQSIEKMKQKYLTASIDSAQLQTDYGRMGRNIGLVTFAVFCSRLGFPNTDDKEILQVISQQTQNLGGMWTSGVQTQIQQKTATATLELAKFQSKTAKVQSEGSAKQELTALLQSLGDNLKSASQSR